MHLLSTGLGAVQILFSPAAIEYKFNSILAPAFLANFGVNMNFIDWLPIFLIAIIQGFLISLLIFTAKIRKESRELSKKNKGAKIPRSSESGKTSAIAAGLAVLGTGCPTCGTSLLVPILGAAFAGSSAVIGAISGVLMFIAILIALLSLQKVAEEYYVLSVMVKKLRQSKTKTDEASSQ
jgi:hypothetical protein